MQQLGAAVGGDEAGDVLEGVDGQLDGPLGDLGRGPMHDGGQAVVVGAADFQQVAGLDGLAAQNQRALSHGSGGCDGHEQILRGPSDFEV